MKKSFIAALLFILPACTFSQTKADIFDTDIPVTWLGADFSRARIIGDRERLPTESDVVQLMTSINELMKKEAEKYSACRALKRKTCETAFDITTDHNVALDVSQIILPPTQDDVNITADDIQEIIDSYDFGTHKGLGVMINYGALYRKLDEGTIFFTVVNMDTKQVLLTEKYTLKAGGANVRNYWARLVVDTIEKIKGKDFEVWRKKNSY